MPSLWALQYWVDSYSSASLYVEAFPTGPLVTEFEFVYSVKIVRMNKVIFFHSSYKNFQVHYKRGRNDSKQDHIHVYFPNDIKGNAYVSGQIC